MRLRCPSSVYVGVGRLPGFRWIINARGYANIVSSGDLKHVVYGLIYELTPADEAALDRNEGVPFAYTKETMAIEYWESSRDPIAGASESERKQADVAKPGKLTDMLVYIDRQRTHHDKAKKEYVHRMNMGIVDALAMGVPLIYVEECMRPFIPPSVSAKAEALANEQAMSFKEEADR